MDVPRNLANRISAMRIRLNPDRMRAHNLSSEDIMKALTPSTMIGPDERLDEAMGKMFQLKEYELILIWRYNKPEQYENIILKASPDGEILRLKDVGRVELAPPFFDISSDIDGHPATAIVLKPLPGWSAAIAIEAHREGPRGAEGGGVPSRHELRGHSAREPGHDLCGHRDSSGLDARIHEPRCHELGAIARGIDGITSVSSLAGYQIRTEGRGWNAGTCLIHLKDRSGRKLTSRQIIETARGKMPDDECPSRVLRAARGFGLRRGRGFLRTRPGQDELAQRQAAREWARDVHG